IALSAALFQFKPASTVAKAEEQPADGPPKVVPVPQAVRDKFKLDPFYEKYTEAKGFPVMSSAKVSDAGLLEAADIINHMLENREDAREAMIQGGARVMVMAPTEMTTDVPEQRHWDKEYWDRRARGMGGRLTSCGEENLLNLRGDRY